MPCALQKYLNTRKIFGIKKMPMGSFFPKMLCAMQKYLNTRKIFLDRRCPLRHFLKGTSPLDLF